MNSKEICFLLCLCIISCIVSLRISRFAYQITTPLSSRQISPVRSLRLHGFFGLQKQEESTPELLVEDIAVVNTRIAKEFSSSKFGIMNYDILAEDFINIKSFLEILSKKKYLEDASKSLSALIRAVPDYELRSYDFIVDEVNPNIIRFKTRARGTFTGVLSYRGEVYQPSNKEVIFPIEHFAITLKGQKIVSVASGYVIDRFVGNTGGLIGPEGILYTIGEAPPKITYLPPIAVVKQFFSRTYKV